jgi:hypothetical protein
VTRFHVGLPAREEDVADDHVRDGHGVRRAADRHPGRRGVGREDGEVEFPSALRVGLPRDGRSLEFDDHLLPGVGLAPDGNGFPARDHHSVVEFSCANRVARLN